MVTVERQLKRLTFFPLIIYFHQVKCISKHLGWIYASFEGITDLVQEKKSKIFPNFVKKVLSCKSKSVTPTCKLLMCFSQKHTRLNNTLPWNGKSIKIPASMRIFLGLSLWIAKEKWFLSISDQHCRTTSEGSVTKYHCIERSKFKAKLSRVHTVEYGSRRLRFMGRYFKL